METVTSSVSKEELEKNKKEFLAQPGVKQKIQSISNKLGISKEELLHAIGKETAGSFSSAQRNLGDGKAVGLIQFYPDKKQTYKTIAGKKYEINDLELMSELEQLEVVESYLTENFKNKGGNPGELYVSIAYPSLIGANDEQEIPASRLDSVAAQNPGWVDSDGKIRKSSISAFGSKPEFSEETTKLDKEVRVEIDKEIDNIYGPQIQRLKDKGFNDLAVELEKEAELRAEELKRTLKGATDTKAVTAALENEQLRFLSEEQQNKSKIPSRSMSHMVPVSKLNDLQRAGINLTPQAGYKDVLFDKEKQSVIDTNEKYISQLNEIIENKDDKYTFGQIKDAQASLDKLIAFNEDNKPKIAVLNKRSEKTPSPVTQKVFEQRTAILEETGNVISGISDAKKVLDEKEKTEKTQLVTQEEEQKFFTGPDGKKYPYQTVEPGEEDTITTEGLIEPLDTEVTLEGEPGIGKTLTPLEEYEQEQLKKQQRREKIANLAQGLGDGIKAAGVALMAGAGLKSMHEATKEHKINKIRVSPLMEEAFQKAKAMSTQGLTYAERAAAMADLNNAYAGAMKNVMAVSGGQRSTALANMGVVDASRVNALVDLAGKDAALRQGNMKMYQEQAVNYGKMQLSADSTNEQLRATLEEGRKNRLTKIGSSLFSEATEFSRNLADQKNNKELLDQFANVKNQLAVSTKETSHIMEMLEKANLGVDLGQ